MITWLGEEGAGLCASRCLFCPRQFLSFFSSSWCQGLAAACDCGTPRTFLLICLLMPRVLKTGFYLGIEELFVSSAKN